MKRLLPFMILVLFFSFSLTPVLIGCGSDDGNSDDSDGDDGDGDSVDGDTVDGDDSLFVSQSVAPITGDVDFKARAVAKLPRKNNSDFFIAMQAEDESDSRIEKHSVSGVSDDGNEIMFNKETIASLSDYGLGGNNIIGFEPDVCGTSFMLVNDRGNTFNTWFVPLTGEAADIVPLDTYSHAWMWVRGCPDSRRAQIFGFSKGPVINGQDVTNEIWKADLWDWDPSREEPWIKIENVMADLPDGRQFLFDKEVAFFGGYKHDYDWGSALVAIGPDGSLYWLRTSMPNDPKDIRWAVDETVFRGFNGRGFVATSIDIEQTENLWLVDHVSDRADDVPTRYICVVGHEENSETPLLWVANTNDGGVFGFNENNLFEIGFEGPCSITSFSEAISPTASVYYPWVAFRSAKNELSAMWISQTDGDWWQTVIDSIPQTAWHFASSHLVMGTLGSGASNRVAVAYDDNDSIRIATCKGRGPCGDY